MNKYEKIWVGFVILWAVWVIIFGVVWYYNMFENNLWSNAWFSYGLPVGSGTVMNLIMLTICSIKDN